MKKVLDVGELHRNLPSMDALIALLAFEKEGDLVQAATSLQLTQPALSFQLKKLEEKLDFHLFSVSGKRKVLTNLGQQYVETLKAALFQLHANQIEISRLGQALDHQKLRVGGRRELFLPFLTFPFPGQLEFIQMSSKEALKALREHRLDLALSARTTESSELVSKLFFESSFKIILPKKWKFETSQLESLKSKPVVVYGNQHAYLENYLQWKGWRFSQLSVSRVVEDWFSVVELVKNNFGWAIIPEAWGVHTPEVQVFSLNEDALPTQKIFLFYRRDDRKAPWVKKLDEWLKLPS